jgi:glycosyltransferase involved in cell wall biosynthesis
MKILHVINTLSPRYGGPVKACKELCSSLAHAGEDVTIYTTDLNYPMGVRDVVLNQEIKQDGYSLYYFHAQFNSYVFSLEFFKAIKNNIKKFDIVHIHGIYRFPQTITAYFCRKYGLPYIIRPHGSLSPYLFNSKRRKLRKRLYEYLIENRNLNNASAIHYTTEEEMVLAKPLGLKSNTFICPISIDISKYNDLPVKGIFRGKYKIDNSKKIILYFGRINFVKGLDILIKAFAKTLNRFQNVLLVIAGPDNEGYQAQVEQWIKNEKIGKNVILTGMLIGGDILELLKDTDIFVLPSYTENFGIAVAEAMACGLPVVVSNKVNIYRDVLKAGAGLVTNCDSNEISDAFFQLLEDEKRRKTLGRAGVKLVKGKYSPDKVVKNVIKLYHGVLNV